MLWEYIVVDTAFLQSSVSVSVINLSLGQEVRNREFHSSFTVTSATFIGQFLGSTLASLSVGKKLNSVFTVRKGE